MMTLTDDGQGADAPDELTTERASDLAALETAVRAQEAIAQESQETGQGGENGVLVVELHREIAGALSMVSKMLAPALPSVAAIYTDEVCAAIGNSLAPVCEKYGWLQDGVGGKYGPEILALCIVGPIAWATVEAAKTDLAAKKPKKPESLGINLDATPGPEVGGQAAPGQKTVSFGSVIA